MLGPSEEVSEDARWERWKGSYADVASVFRRALELFKEATGKPAEPIAGQLIHISLSTGRKTYGTIEAFQEAAPTISWQDLQYLVMSLYSDAVHVDVMFGYVGASLRVTGSDKFGVAGVFKALRQELDRGRRWTQFAVVRPANLHLVAPWVALAGLAVSTFIDGSVAAAIAVTAVLAGFLLFGAALFMTFVEPRLVPPLELLPESAMQTRAQKWSRRLVQALVFLGIGFLGAVINEITGILF